MNIIKAAWGINTTGGFICFAYKNIHIFLK